MAVLHPDDGGIGFTWEHPAHPGVPGQPPPAV